MGSRTTQLSILLVMKNAEFRRALIVALRLLDPAITIAGESGNCVEALDLFRVTAPSLVLMDATLRPIPFSEMTERMLGFDPATRIIGVTNIFEGRRACQLLSYGAKGHIARTMSPETIIRIIRLVAQGETIIEADLSE